MLGQLSEPAREPPRGRQRGERKQPSSDGDDPEKMPYRQRLYSPSMSGRRKTVLVIDADDDDARAARDAAAPRLPGHARRVRRGRARADGARTMSIVLSPMSKLPGLSGLELLHIVARTTRSSRSSSSTATSDVDGAVQAIKLGAYHFLAKSSDPDTLRATVAHARRAPGSEPPRADPACGGAGARRPRVHRPDRARAMRGLLETVHKVGKLSATVLILGESGTGKELLARMIHRDLRERPVRTPGDRPFIAVNVAAIPRELVESTLFGHEKGSFTGALQQRIGKFELANGGTLFLDEIGDLKLDLQAKLLRAIQEGEIERVGGAKPIKTTFRLIAATNVDLERAVKEGTFREDLYYRLNVIPVRLPPLRDRIEDLPELAEFFLRALQRALPQERRGHRANRRSRCCRTHRWPGNIRELENLIERVVATCRSGEWITDDDLPFEFHVAELDHEQVGRQPARSGAGDVRAQLHRARARAQRLERDADGALPGRAAVARSSSRWIGSRSASWPGGSKADSDA